MNLKILSMTTVEAREVRKGDLLIDPRLPYGFGHVECVGLCESPSLIVAIGIEGALGKRAIEFDPWEPVDVAESILDAHGYGTRVVQWDAAVFNAPRPLYEGPCSVIHPLIPMGQLAGQNG